MSCVFNFPCEHVNVCRSTKSKFSWKWRAKNKRKNMKTNMKIAFGLFSMRIIFNIYSWTAVCPFSETSYEKNSNTIVCYKITVIVGFLFKTFKQIFFFSFNFSKKQQTNEFSIKTFLISLCKGWLASFPPSFFFCFYCCFCCNFTYFFQKWNVRIMDEF